MKRENVVLQTGLKELSGQYEKHCREKGLKDSSIQLYMKLGLRFLKGLEDAGAESAKDINADRVMQGRFLCDTIEDKITEVGGLLEYFK